MFKPVGRVLSLCNRCTPITALIQVILKGRRNKWLLISILFGLPVYILLTGFLIARLDAISHNFRIIGMTYLAAFWTWIGPLFIWRYEHVTTVRFWVEFRKVVVNKEQFFSVKKKHLKTPLSGFANVLIILFWCALITSTFVASYGFMKGFGVNSPSDVWWIVQVLGVSFYAFITGIGFLLVIKTMLMIRDILPIKTKIDPYHPDQRGGLGCFGKLLAETSFMFSSGAFFVPILLTLHRAYFAYRSNLILITLGIFTVMIGLSFFVPVVLIHKKIFIERHQEITKIGNLLKRIEQEVGNGRPEVYLKHIVCRDMYLDLNKIITWPFNLQNLYMAVVSIILPVLLTGVQMLVTKVK